MYDSKKPFKRGAAAFRSSRPAGRGFGAPREEREMHTATCNKCRMACEVPFRPNGKKPVYCRNCFVRDEEQAPRSSYDSRDAGAERSFSRPSSDNGGIAALTKDVATISAKLDVLIALLKQVN